MANEPTTIHGDLAVEWAITRDSGVTESRVPIGFQTPIVDDFERQTLAYYAGQIGGLAIETSNPIEGDASLRTDDNSLHRVRSPFKARRGFRYRMYYRFDTHSVQDYQLADLEFGIAEGTHVRSGSGYQFRSQVDGSENISIGRWDNAAFTSLNTASATIPTDTDLVLEVDVNLSELVLRVLQVDGTQVGSVSTTDTTYVGDLFLQYLLRSNETGNQTYIDYITRRPL